MSRRALLFALLGVQSSFQTAAPFLSTEIEDASLIQKRDISHELGPRLSPGAAIYSPSSPQWANESSRWSTYSAPTFAYVVVPATEQDIVTTIKYATSHNITFLAQGGGHGYSATLSVIQDAIMIHLEKFVYAIVDNSTQTARVGGGTTFGTLITALHQQGQVLPVGVSPCVGATGATIGGGHGRLNGIEGLMIDRVESFRVVLADGRIVNASTAQNSDLFYGLRGAGQNFGVITETLFKTADDPAPGGLYYNVDMEWTGDKLEAVLDVFNEIIPTQVGELALIFLMSWDSASSSVIVKVNMVYAGTRASGLQYTQKFNNTSPTTLSESLISFADLPAKSNGGAFAAACAKGSKNNNYSANMKLFNLSTMRTNYESFSTFLNAYPDARLGSGWLVEVFGQGAEKAVSSASTAYPNRAFDNIIPIIGTAYTQDSTAAAADKYAREARDLVAATSGYGKLYVYQNYAHGDEPLGSFYGYSAQRMGKLRCLKGKYDPRNVFFGYHDIMLPVKGECH